MAKKMPTFYVTYLIQGRRKAVTITMTASDQACALGCVLDDQEEELEWVTVSRTAPRKRKQLRPKAKKKPVQELTLKTMPAGILRAYREGLEVAP